MSFMRILIFAVQYIESALNSRARPSNYRISGRVRPLYFATGDNRSRLSAPRKRTVVAPTRLFEAFKRMAHIRLQFQPGEGYEKVHHADSRAHGRVDGIAFPWLIYAVCSCPGHRESSIYEPQFSAEQRATDLVHRMTLAEKASQMLNRSAAVQRLNVPAYQWWSEALHGVIDPGVTEYPEPIGLAATFDTAEHSSHGDPNWC